MANLFRSDPNNERRLVATVDEAHTLRGFIHRDDDQAQAVTITIEWGPSDTPNRKPDVLCISGRLWPGGARLADVVRPWKRGGDWHTAWNECRRQVRDITGIEIGDPPHKTG
jgi:hypothetical protein